MHRGRVGGNYGSDITESLLPSICCYGNCSGGLYRHSNRTSAERSETRKRNFQKGTSKCKQRAERKETEDFLFGKEKNSDREKPGRKKEQPEAPEIVQKEIPHSFLEYPSGAEHVSQSDTDAFVQTIIQVYQKSSGLKEMLDLLLQDNQGAYEENVHRAAVYLNESRYKDFETTLDYLLAGIDAGKLKGDLLQWEIMKHRRIGML